jgi:hypothetical protein
VGHLVRVAKGEDTGSKLRPSNFSVCSFGLFRVPGKESWERRICGEGIQEGSLISIASSHIPFHSPPLLKMLVQTAKSGCIRTVKIPYSCFFVATEVPELRQQGSLTDVSDLEVGPGVSL